MTLPEGAAGGVPGAGAGHLIRVDRPALASTIFQELNRRGTVVVTGSPGVGKTYLIEHGVYPRCSEHFKSMVRWTDQIRKHLTSPTGEFVPNWHRPVLLLLDDVAGPESFPDVLLAHDLQLIVVSRAPAARWRHFPAVVVEVGAFSREESVRFLRDNLGRMTEAEAERLAEHLGDLPLALAEAVRWFTPGVTVDDFLRKVRTHAPVMFGAGRGGDRASSLMDEVRRCVHDLPETGELSPRIVLGALALTDGVPFPAFSLDAQLRLPGWRSALNGLPPDRRVPLHGLAAVLRDLERRGLVRMADGEVHLVWLTCQLVRHALAPAELERSARLAEAMLLGTVPDSKGEARWEDRLHWQASAPVLNAIDPACLTTSPGRHALLAACDSLLEQGRAAEARDRLSVLRETWKRTKNVPLDLRLKALDLLARASHELGETRLACRYGETAFRARRAANGRREFDAVTLAGAAHWAWAAQRVDWLTELRQLAEDIPDQRLALRIGSFAMLLGVQSPFSLCLAEPIDEIFRAQRDILGADHPHTLFTMDLLAHAYDQSGRADEARTTFIETLKLRTLALGARHPDTQATADALYRWPHGRGGGLEEGGWNSGHKAGE